MEYRRDTDAVAAVLRQVRPRQRHAQENRRPAEQSPVQRGKQAHQQRHEVPAGGGTIKSTILANIRDIQKKRNKHLAVIEICCKFAADSEIMAKT